MKRRFRIKQITISYTWNIPSGTTIIFDFVLFSGIAKTVQSLIIRSDIRKQLGR
ncbi:MAG: hypothetical protein IPN08_14060 [Bacteroidales bacterium]|nr:hypothetical protein [Bacteroidales bacterium]MBK9358483.1 hypothetical protein [Bacteroidales bacterium]